MSAGKCGALPCDVEQAQKHDEIDICMMKYKHDEINISMMKLHISMMKLHISMMKLHKIKNKSDSYRINQDQTEI